MADMVGPSGGLACHPSKGPQNHWICTCMHTRSASSIFGAYLGVGRSSSSVLAAEVTTWLTAPLTHLQEQRPCLGPAREGPLWCP